MYNLPVINGILPAAHLESGFFFFFVLPRAGYSCSPKQFLRFSAHSLDLFPEFLRSPRHITRASTNFFIRPLAHLLRSALAAKYRAFSPIPNTGYCYFSLSYSSVRSTSMGSATLRFKQHCRPTSMGSSSLGSSVGTSIWSSVWSLSVGFRPSSSSSSTCSWTSATEQRRI